jgi:hypothetical protein
MHSIARYAAIFLLNMRANSHLVSFNLLPAKKQPDAERGGEAIFVLFTKKRE